ncbi:MAG: DMT family transporter [Spirochaetaceae bacterium]|nr:MAG: DMT family transporter [Spirochaetaceae bacterium]
MAIGIALTVAAATGYTVNTLFLALLGRRAGFTTTKYIFLIALAANLLIHLIVFGRPFPSFERIEYLLYLGASGIIGYVLGYVAMIAALPLIGPRLVLLLLTSQTAMSFFAGWAVLGETLNPLGYLYVVMVMAGIILAILNKRVSVEDRRHLTTGILFSLALGFCQTLSQFLSKKALLGGITPLSAKTTRLNFATVGVFIFAAAAGHRIGVRVSDLQRQDWLKITLAALVGPVLSVFLSFTALKFITLGVAAAMLQLSPVLMLFLARIVFKEKIKPVAVLGTLLAVSGTVLLALS